MAKGSNTFGGTVKLSGETEYRRALSNITAQLGVFSSELVKLNSTFGKNDKSIDSLSAKNDVLNKKLEAQNSRVSVLSDALKNSINLYGEEDKRTLKWQQSLNKAQTDIIKTTTEIQNNKKAMDDSKNAYTKLTTEIENQKQKLNSLSKDYASVVLEQGKNSREAQTLAKQIKELSNNITTSEKKLKDSTSAIKNFASAEENAGQSAVKMGDFIKANVLSEYIIRGIDSLVGGIKNVASSVGNMIVTGGMDRALNIEQAEFKLKGLGHSTKETDQIMKNALASVKGTSYGLGDAATVAASAVASGVKPGKELERTLKLVADAATISGRDMNDMGSIFNKVAANGKLSGDELNQLSDSGIPVLQLLSESMGKSTDEVRKLVSAGKIGFPEFQNAIEKGMGGAAQTMGQTFEGSLSNMKAALSRIGADFMGPLTEGLTPVMGTVTQILDAIEGGATENVNELIVNLSGQIETMVNGLVQNLKPMIETAIPVLGEALQEVLFLIRDLMPEVMPLIVETISQIATLLIESLPQITEVIISAISSLASSLTAQLPTLIPIVINSVMMIVDSLLNNIDLLIDAGLQLLLGLTQGLIDAVPQLIEKIPVIFDKLITAITNNLPKLVSAGIKLIVMLNVGLIKSIPTLIASIPKLISAFVKGFTNQAKSIWHIGRDLVKGIWKGISNATSWVLEKIKGFGKSIVNGIKDVFKIKSPSKVMKEQVGKNIALGVIEGIKTQKSNMKKSAKELAKLYVTAANQKATSLKNANRITATQEVSFWNTIVAHAKKGTSGYNSAVSKLEKAKSSLKSSVSKQTSNFMSEMKKLNENIAKRKDEIMNSLSLFDSVKFDGVTTKGGLKENLSSQVSALKEWDNTLTSLKNKIKNKSLYSYLEDQGVSSLNTLKEFDSMSSKELKEYEKLYSEKEKIAKKRAEKENASEVTTLKNNYLKNLKSLGVDGTKVSKTVGKQIALGISQGFSKGMEGVTSSTKNQLNKLLKSIKKQLKIKSPSQVFRDEVGKQLAAGIGVGFTSQMKNVSLDMNNAIPTSFSINPTVETGFKSKPSTVNTNSQEIPTSNFTAIINNNSRYTSPAENVRLLRKEYELHRLKYRRA